MLYRGSDRLVIREGTRAGQLTSFLQQATSLSRQLVYRQRADLLCASAAYRSPNLGASGERSSGSSSKRGKRVPDYRSFRRRVLRPGGAGSPGAPAASTAVAEAGTQRREPRCRPPRRPKPRTKRAAVPSGPEIGELEQRVPRGPVVHDHNSELACTPEAAKQHTLRSRSGSRPRVIMY